MTEHGVPAGSDEVVAEVSGRDRNKQQDESGEHEHRVDQANSKQHSRRFLPPSPFFKKNAHTHRQAVRYMIECEPAE